MRTCSIRLHLGKNQFLVCLFPDSQSSAQAKKANVVLNKEQEKLNATVSGLQKNIVGLQEKAKQQEAEYAKNNPKPTLRQRISAFWAKLFAGKKE